MDRAAGGKGGGGARGDAIGGAANEEGSMKAVPASLKMGLVLGRVAADGGASSCGERLVKLPMPVDCTPGLAAFPARRPALGAGIDIESTAL